jgi:hypothetical protein
MSDWNKKGCETCRRQVLSGQSDLLEKTASVPFLMLRRCPECHSYWEVGDREAHVITLEEARKTFPDAFPST